MQSRRIRVRLAVLLCTLTLVRVALAHVFYGFHSGDDVEILQEAFRRALEWPYEPWDIRNLLFSEMIVAPAVAAAAFLGVSSVRELTILAAAPLIILATLNVLLVFLLARRWLQSDDAAWWAALLYGCHWLPLGYGSTVYPRTASTTAILGAVLLIAGTDQRWRRLFAAGGLVAIASGIRYSEAIFLLPLLCVAVARQGSRDTRLKALGTVAAGFVAAGGLTVGISDWMQWGRPFASLIAFGRYTIMERQSSSLQAFQPVYWYIEMLPKWLPITLLPLLWSARRTPHAREIAGFVAIPLAILTMVHHKEMRYLQGVIPFLTILAGAGAWHLYGRGRRRLVVALLAGSLVLGALGLTFLAKKSMPAVLAAEEWSKRVSGSGLICTSQRWAYGGSLYTPGHVPPVDLPYPLSAPDLVQQIGRCGIVALYERDYRGDPRIGGVLRNAGMSQTRRFESGRSKKVLVFETSTSTQHPALSTKQ